MSTKNSHYSKIKWASYVTVKNKTSFPLIKYYLAFVFKIFFNFTVYQITIFLLFKHGLSGQMY